MLDWIQVPVTQFLLPDGRKREVSINRPKAVADQALEVIATGLRFEAEILSTGEVHMTVADTEESLDLHSVLVRNGPQVPEAFDRLVHVAWVNLDPANRVMEFPHE